MASEAFLAEHGHPQTPEELIQLPAVIYSNGNVILDQMHLSQQPHGEQFKSYKMQGNYKVSDVRTIIEAVKDGLGYTHIDLFNLNQSITELKLVPLLTSYSLSTMDTGIYAVYPHRKQTLLVSEFIKAVQQYIGTPPRWVEHVPNYKNLYK